MMEELHIFKPARKVIALVSAAIAIVILLNLYCVYLYSYVALYVTLVFLVALFVFLFVPILKNQKLAIQGNNIYAYSFGKSHNLNFQHDLKEIVVSGDRILSFRFEKSDMFYQISPSAYTEPEELQGLLDNLMKLNKNTISVVKVARNVRA